MAARHQPDARLGAFEVGHLAWNSRLPVVDLLGLVTEVAPESVRALDMAAIEKALDIDLLVFWLKGGPLFEALARDPAGFYDRWHLDAVVRRGSEGLALYRRPDRPARGPVLLDLVADASRRGFLVEEIHRHRIGGYGVRLASGESIDYEVPGDSRRFEAAAIGLRGPLALRAEVRTEARPSVAEYSQAGESGRWTWWNFELDGRPGRSTLRIRCEAQWQCVLVAARLERDLVQSPGPGASTNGS
jgi:hypothetical protein